MTQVRDRHGRFVAARDLGVGDYFIDPYDAAVANDEYLPKPKVPLVLAVARSTAFRLLDTPWACWAVMVACGVGTAYVCRSIGWPLVGALAASAGMAIFCGWAWAMACIYICDAADDCIVGPAGVQFRVR